MDESKGDYVSDGDCGNVVFIFFGRDMRLEFCVDL